MWIILLSIFSKVNRKLFSLTGVSSPEREALPSADEVLDNSPVKSKFPSNIMFHVEVYKLCGSIKKVKSG